MVLDCGATSPDHYAPSMRLPRTPGDFARAVLGPLVHEAWTRISRVAVVSADSPVGRRYAHIGSGTAIGFPRGAVFGERWISVGSNTLVAPYVSMSVGLPTMPPPDDWPPVIEVGDRCTIGRGSWLVGGCGITIEDDVITGPNVYITDHNHDYENVDVPIWQGWPAKQAPVRIGAGSWLGANVVVLPGADIGCNVTVAAGSVVRGTIPDRCVVAGAPARIVRRYDEVEGWVAPIRALAEVEVLPATPELDSSSG